LTSAGHKNFCLGGDIKSLYHLLTEAKTESERKAAELFFKTFFFRWYLAE
jgi:enoyl-CoA hydratase/carnithine racemase